MVENASQAKTALDHARNTDNSIAVREAAYEESGRLYQGALAHLPNCLDKAITYKNLIHVYAGRVLLLVTVSGWATPRIYAFWLPLLMESAREYTKNAALYDSHAVQTQKEVRPWRPVSDMLRQVLDAILTHLCCGGEDGARRSSAASVDMRLTRTQCVIAACRSVVDTTCSSAAESTLLLWWGKLQLQLLVLRAQRATAMVVMDGPHSTVLECAIRTPQLHAVYTDAASIFAADGVEAALAAIARVDGLLSREEKNEEMRRIVEECAAVREQLEFVHRRGIIVTTLWHALRRRDTALLGNNNLEFDMDEVLHTMDDIRYALMLAAGNRTTGSGGATRIDVEAKCICLHELAELHNVVFHHKEKAYDLHVECLRMAASLTTEEVSEDTPPTGILSSKRWYMRSWKFVQRTRQTKAQTCAQTHSDQFKHIASDVDDITRAFRELPMLSFCQFLYKYYPPRRVWAPKSTTSYRRSLGSLRAAEFAGHRDVFPHTLTKRVLLEMVRDYASSHQGQYFPNAEVPVGWHLLCTEIQKLLNIFYSAEYKARAAVARKDGEHQEEGRGRTEHTCKGTKDATRHRSDPPRQEQWRRKKEQEQQEQQQRQQQRQQQQQQQQQQQREEEQQQQKQKQEQEREQEQREQQQQQQQHEPEPECDETQKDTNFVPRKQPATATNCEAEPAQAQSQNDPTPGTPRCQDHVPEPADSKEKEPTPSHTSPSAPMDEDKSPEHKDEDCRSTESDDANAPDSSDDDTDATGRMYASDLQINKERAVAYKNRAVHSFERAIHVAGTKGWKTPSLYTEHIPSLCRNICNAIDHNERVLAMVLGAAAKNSDNNDDATIVRAHAREWNESLIQHLCRLLWLWRSAMTVEECPLVRYQYGRFCLTALRPLRTQASHLLHQYPPLTIVWCTLQVEMLTCSLARSQALHRAHPVAEAIRAHNDAWEDEVHQVDNALSCHAPLIATVRQHYENNTDVTPHKAILGMILCRAEAAEARLAFMRRRAVIVRIVRHAVRRAQKLWTGLLATQVDQDSVLDDLWYAYTIADNCTGSTGGDKGRTNDDPGWPDVEMGCICVHELARVHHVLGTKNPREGDIGHVEKAYELHLETLRRACAMSAEHVQGDPEGGLLSTRSWYFASHAYIKKARAERERRLAQSHAQDLVHIRPELTHVQNTFAAVSMLDFLHFLYTTYPPYSHVRNNVNVVLPDRVTETSVLQAIQQYAPTLDDEPRTSSLLCAEILKLLNTWYIDRYKSATTNGREAERGTKPSPPLHERYERSTSCHDAERSPRASRRDEAPSARASSTIHGDARGRRQRGWCARRAASVGTMLSGCTDEREFCPLL